MSISRSNDPTTFDDVDGIVVDESSPAANIQGVATNIAIAVAQAERGDGALTEVGSIGELQQKYGKNPSFGLNKLLQNKKFGRLKIIRVLPTGAVQALKAFASSATDRITFYAKQGVGAFGNSIQVKIENGTTIGKKYTIQDIGTGATLPTEVYDNVEITSAASKFGASNLITVVVNSTAAEPANIAFTALATGANGTVSDTDYQTAIAVAETEGAGNVLFLDEYNSTRNGYLKAHAANVTDKMVILSHAENDNLATILTDIAANKDVDGNLIYAVNWVQSSVDGSLQYSSPAHWLAAIFSQTAPHVDLAYARNVQFTTGATGLKMNLSRANYIALKDAGGAAFENDGDLGIKLKSAIVTQTADSEKVTISRRRMAYFLENSAGKFLKNFQNAVNSKENRVAANAAIEVFQTGLENDGILPKDSEMTDGKKASLIDTESANTNSTIAAGFFRIIWKRRIYSSMRYIVLSIQVGASVEVSAQA